MPNSHITKPRIYIQARDDDGVMHNLSIPSWEKITGMKQARIRRLYHLRIKRGYTNRQIVGFDPVPGIDRSHNTTRPKTNKQTVNAFLRQGLRPRQHLTQNN